ncbi:MULTISPECIES: hypothetical protein [Actinomadura]
MNLRITPPPASRKTPFAYGKHIRPNPRPLLRKPPPPRGRKGR